MLELLPHNSKTMLSLEHHHIIDLYVLIDDLIPSCGQAPKAGRHPTLQTSEVITILIWNTLTVRQKTLKDIYRWIKTYHENDFPSLSKYNAFLDQCHRAAPQLYTVLQQLLVMDASVRFMDSTMIPVCKNVRADTHKVAKGIAQFGKNHQGWHYGFKLHASIDKGRRFCGLMLTPANMHDAQAMPFILDESAEVAVGDTAYTARVMRDYIWETYGTIIVSPPHPKQNKKMLTQWQHLLLNMRPKIESVFDYLKEHLYLVTSFPRSVKGYLLHYLRILLGYQLYMLL